MLKWLKEDISCVFDRDPAARNKFEVLTTYPGVHAIMIHRFSHALWRRGFKWLGRVISLLARWLTGIEIHPGAQIGHRFFIDHGMGVVIGETAVIGDDCTLYQGVTLGGTSLSEGKRHPTLGNNVIVGAGAKVLGPFLIGDNARVGSNAVVLKEVPERATVVGVPGRIARTIEGPRSEQRMEVAKKIGFDAYGMTADMPDPVLNAVNSVLDHIHLSDKRLEELCKAINALGGHVNADLPELQSCLFDQAPLDRKPDSDDEADQSS